MISWGRLHLAIMLPIKRILVPVDFSERCLRMIADARRLATIYSAELTLLHVVNPMYSFPATAISGPAMIPIPEAIIADRQKELDQFAAPELQGLTVRRFVYEGDPVDQIAGFVQSEDVSMIVMPTHGYGILRRFLIGSVTAKVLHDVSCPVFTGVHLEHHDSATPALSHVLCAVDLGPQSAAVLSWAGQFAADCGAQLDLAHAVASSESLAGTLSALGKLQEEAGVKATDVYSRPGDLATVVCDLAKDINADVIVIGRGHREEADGILATNAYAIVRQSPRPVVSV